MMRNSAMGPSAVCNYRVDAGGKLSIWRSGKCEAGKGTWKTAGPHFECEAKEPALCSLRCSR
jgi:hypothetical protein